MPFGFAVALLLAAIAGIVLACKLLRKNRAARILCIIGCGLIALACAVYIGLTIIFVDAAMNQPVDAL